MKRIYTIFLVIALWPCFGLMAQDCQLKPPANLSVSDVTSCSATLHWTSSNPMLQFAVSYKPIAGGQWSTPISVGSNLSYQFTNLQPAVKYYLAVTAKCPGGNYSQRRKNPVTILQCTLPDTVLITPFHSGAAKISFTTSCTYDSVHIKFSTLNGPSQIVSFAAANVYSIGGLNPDSTYLFQVTTCKLSLNNWTTTYTFHPLPPPNIILILTDDSRYDYYSCNGAPPFFHTPNIDRIANEGVNFKKSFCVTSLCAPGRAAIATGLFTLKTGVTENGIALDTSFVTVPKLLKNHGYYTVLIGKNHDTFLQDGVNEFNYYLEDYGYDITSGKKFILNGTMVNINSDYIRTLTDTTIAIIKRVNTPLFIWLAPKIPHFPELPLQEFVGRYDNYVIPWHADTARYKVNYPSFIYLDSVNLLHGIGLDTTYRQILEVVAGMDSCIGQIINALEATGKLDNTLLIFTTDNGFMLGNHWLNGKTHAYDPSMRIPLFVRYPKWFSPHTVITDQFALNLDIASTMYDAAGVKGPPTDGFSLRSLYTGKASRTSFYYLMLHNAAAHEPTKRAIRDQYYKYIHYTCNSDTVEEFFDMVHDSLELTNLINNSAYDSLIGVYRLKYDSIRIAWNDTSVGPIKDCFIKNPSPLKQMLDDDEITPQDPVIYPTLTSGSVEIYVPWISAKVRVFDSFGNLVKEWQINDAFSKADFSNLPNGVYMLNLSNATKSVTEKLILEHQ